VAPAALRPHTADFYAGTLRDKIDLIEVRSDTSEEALRCFPRWSQIPEPTAVMVRKHTL